MMNFTKNYDCPPSDDQVKKEIGIGSESSDNLDLFVKLSDKFQKNKRRFMLNLFPVRLYGITIKGNSAVDLSGLQFWHCYTKDHVLYKYCTSVMNWLRADSMNPSLIYIPIDEYMKYHGLEGIQLFIDANVFFTTKINANTKIEFDFILSEKRHNSLLRYHKIA